MDDDSRSLDVADQAAIPLNGDFLGDFHVALNVTRDHHFARPDLRLHLSARPNGQPMLQLELALYFAVDVQLFAAEDVALDDHGTSDGRRRARGWFLRNVTHPLRRRRCRRLSRWLCLRIPVGG